MKAFLYKLNMGFTQSKYNEDKYYYSDSETVTTVSSDSDDSSIGSSIGYESSSHGPLHTHLNIPSDVIVTHHSADTSYAKERISFEMLVDSHKHAKRDVNGRPIGRGSLFFRSPEVEACMTSDFEQAKKKYAKPTDVLKIEGFGWDGVETEDGKITAVRGENAAREIVWMKNKYPYAWEDGIEHFLCWSTGGPALSLDECISAIQENVGPDKEVVWFTNSMENRSVPEIDHIQVIVR